MLIIQGKNYKKVNKKLINNQLIKQYIYGTIFIYEKIGEKYAKLDKRTK